ncbi:hypothetical protein PR048_011644 [Dryococelus australis]|uniref:Reverse transcriptase/retrotransposon-derived protein RNase H-like domain-containing protein n=1 Tax=Dryococelus australis TaxID=614101 RepID=A0ABQ9HMA1_9NEOP|nr:hypothetical protein PR048_011644 [Dryococelus australis]
MQELDHQTHYWEHSRRHQSQPTRKNYELIVACSLSPQLSSKLCAFYELLKLNVPWEWNIDVSRLSQESKGWFCRSSALVHFDLAKLLVLTLILSHLGENGDHLIGFVSKTLTAAEKYSRLDQEALATIYRVKTFHNYIYGRKLTRNHSPPFFVSGGTYHQWPPPDYVDEWWWCLPTSMVSDTNQVQTFPMLMHSLVCQWQTINLWSLDYTLSQFNYWASNKLRFYSCQSEGFYHMWLARA